MTTVHVRKIDEGQMPIKASEGAAGWDLFSNEYRVIMPGAVEVIRTGICVEMPSGYEGQVRPRSGLAAKYGVTVLNAPGTIDSDYRGEVKVILINHGKRPFQVNRFARIAQLVICSTASVILVEKDELSTTTRGEGGLGSTGV